MIEIRGLTKAFGPRRALVDIDLDVTAGERLMLVGPNGAGKTTLLRMIATLSRPTAGTIRVAGHDVGRDGAAARRLIGYLSHETLLYHDLTARQNLQFYARMYALTDAAARINAVLEQVALARRADDLVGTYSRGMQQRLAVARALLHRPKLLLLDEPYTGLDPLAADALTDLLSAFVEEGSTLVLTTHHPAAEGCLAQRAVILRAGRIIHDAPLGDPAGFPARYRALIAERAGAEAA